MSQSILKSVLKDEQQRLQQLETSLLQHLRQLPKGYLLQRKIGKQTYFYLSYRQKNHIQQDYLGKISQKEIYHIKEQMKQKKQLRQQLQEVKKRLEKLQRALKYI